MQAKDRPPQPPHEPDPADCCGEGCVHCVHDVYDTALARYRVQLAAWQSLQLDHAPAGGEGS